MADKNVSHCNIAYNILGFLVDGDHSEVKLIWPFPSKSFRTPLPPTLFKIMQNLQFDPCISMVFSTKMPRFGM